MRRCQDCGEFLDVWNSCPNVDASRARLESSASGPLYCGQVHSSITALGSNAYRVDMPGVGAVPVSSNLPGRPYVVGEAPETLRRFVDGQLPEGESLSITFSPLEVTALKEFGLRDARREKLLCELMFAARDLASTKILMNRSVLDPAGSEAHCRECNASAGSNVPLVHTPTCRTGRVLLLIAQLDADAYLESKFNRKEEASAEEMGRASDGMRSRGEFGEPWDWKFEVLLDRTKIFDCDGTLVASIAKANREAGEWAQRIVASVNYCEGLAPQYLKQVNATDRSASANGGAQ